MTKMADPKSPIDYQKILGPDYQKMLALVDPRHHEAFALFAETGKMGKAFEDYLDSSKQAQQAVEMALDHRVKGIVAVGKFIAEMGIEGVGDEGLEGKVK